MQLHVYMTNGRAVCAERWNTVFCKLDLSRVYQTKIRSAFFVPETNELISKTKTLFRVWL